MRQANTATEALYHRERARAERLAAARAADERVRRAHLDLAIQHEVAMFRTRPEPPEGDAGVGTDAIGATLRAVMALPDARSEPGMRLDTLSD